MAVGVDLGTEVVISWAEGEQIIICISKKCYGNKGARIHI